MAGYKYTILFIYVDCFVWVFISVHDYNFRVALQLQKDSGSPKVEGVKRLDWDSRSL